jgi:hypothetical protein
LAIVQAYFSSAAEYFTQDTCVMSWFSEAKEMCALVAWAGV